MNETGTSVEARLQGMYDELGVNENTFTLDRSSLETVISKVGKTNRKKIGQFASVLGALHIANTLRLESGQRKAFLEGIYSNKKIYEIGVLTNDTRQKISNEFFDGSLKLACDTIEQAYGIVGMGETPSLPSGITLEAQGAMSPWLTDLQSNALLYDDV